MKRGLVKSSFVFTRAELVPTGEKKKWNYWWPGDIERGKEWKEDSKLFSSVFA